MKKVNFKFSKELLDKVRDDVNLVLFELKGFGMKEMKMVNNIMEVLEGATFNFNID